MLNFSDVPRDEFYDLYIIQNWSIKEVAKHFGVSVGTIQNRAKSYGIKKERSYSSGYKDIPKETLYDLFINRNYSIQKVAEILGKTVWMIQEALKHHNITKSTDQIVSGRKRTNVNKYGVEHTTQLDSVKEKIKQTCFENYGVEYASQSPKIKEKIKQTFIENYGVDHPMRNAVVKQKVRQTVQKRYGNDNTFRD